MKSFFNKHKGILTIILTAVIASLFTAVLCTFRSPVSKINRALTVLDSVYLGEIDKNEVVENAIKGMFSGISDPYTSYLTNDELKNLQSLLEGEFEGVGIYYTAIENELVIISVIDGAPAQKAGVIEGDRIYKINDTPVDMSEIENIASQIMGEAGTKVKLGIRRGDEAFDVEITRGVVTVPSVKEKMLDNNIGFVRIGIFDNNTSEDFISAANSLKEKGAEGLIIDLRGNSGGSFTTCIEICDFLMPESTIVYTRNKDGKNRYVYSNDKYLDLPLCLLVDSGSASASEIMAGALKDVLKTPVVGETTFGKGLVQSLIFLDENSMIKVTNSEYYTPNGNKINGIGITPDYVVSCKEEYKGISASLIPEEEDLQLLKAISLFYN